MHAPLIFAGSFASKGDGDLVDENELTTFNVASLAVGAVDGYMVY